MIRSLFCRMGLVMEPSVGECGMAAVWVAGLEAVMATKNKGGRNIKKVAAKDLKQKRLDKKAKKDAAETKWNKVK